MPYEIIEHDDGRYCVHKEGDPDPLGCHATEADARDQVQALYASEARYYVYMDMSHIGSDLESLTRNYGAEREGPLHITLLYVTGDKPDMTGFEFTPFEITATHIDAFDTEDGFAVHLAIKNEGVLKTIQREIYDRANGMQVSEYSIPRQFKPHITLGYEESRPSEYPVIKPFQFASGDIVLSSDGYQELMRFKPAIRPTRADGYKPTDGMVNEADKALRWRKEYGRGGTEIGVARARDISNRRNLSYDTVKRMKAYFDRHASDRDASGWSPGEDGFPSAGRIAWGLWGGDPGRTWAETIVERTENTESEKAMSETPIRAFTGSPVRAQPDGIVEGLLVTFTGPGQRDLYNEYFDARTDYHIEDGYPVVGERVLYHHGLDETVGVRSVGKVVRAEVRDAGLWVQAQLNLADEYERAIYDLAKTGKLGWSSGALPQSVRAEDGHIKSWAIIEASLTPTPAMPYTTRIEAKSLSIPTIPEPTGAIGLTAKGRGDGVNVEASAEANVDAQTDSTQLDNKGNKAMSPEQLQNLASMLQATAQEIQGMLSAEMAEDDAERMAGDITEDVEKAVKAEDPEDDEAMKASFAKAINTAVRDALARQQKAKQAVKSAVADAFRANSAPAQSAPPMRKGNPVDGGTQVSVGDKFPDWKPEDYSFYASLARRAQAQGQPVAYPIDEAFVREMAGKAKKSTTLKLDKATKSAVIRANELDYSTQVGFGDEWVPELWASQIWEKARVETVVLPSLRVIEMPSNPYKYPVETTDPTVYYVPETQNEDQLTLDSANSPIPDSKVATSNVTFDARKLALRVMISAELAEDGVAGTIPAFRRQAELAMLEAIDYVILNGDEETGSTNINYDGASAIANSRYLAVNGMIKNALVTNTTNRIDNLGSAPTLANLRALRYLLARQKSSKIGSLVYYIHPEVEAKLLGLDEFITMDKAGSRATAQTGMIGLIDGIPVLTTDQIFTADTDGKITNSGNSVERGRIVCAYKPDIYVGFRRRVQQELIWKPEYEAWMLLMSARLDLQFRDNDSVSVLYNVGI